MSYNVILVPGPLHVPDGYLDRIRDTGNTVSLVPKLETDTEVIAICKDFNYIITTLVEPGRFTAKALKELKKCRFIQTLGVGYDGIDLKAATDLGIGTINLGNYCAEELAEHAMALVLTCARWVLGLHERVKSGNPVPPASAEAWNRMSTIKGKTMGIIGLGASGRALIPKAKGFDMQIMAHDPYVSESVFMELGVQSAGFEQLLSESDIVMIHANLTEKTRHMFGMEQFNIMKPNAIIVNIARGGFIDETALCTALKKGYIAGAGLDVTETEPLPANSPLLLFDNVVVTGHNAGSSPQVHDAMWSIPIKELERVTMGKWPENLVNPDVKKNYVAKWGK